MLVPDRYDDGGISGATLERPALKRLLADIEAQPRRRGGGLQDRPAQPLADGLRQAGRGVRPQQRHLRQRHAVVQHHHLDGPADAQHPALLRPVRARGDRRAHPRQVRGLPQEGHVDGRLRAARLRRQGPQAGRERGRGRDGPDDLRALRQDRLGDHAGARACEPRASPASRASWSTRATSTSCSTTGSTSARRCTRAWPIPASTRPSSARRSGTRCTPSCARARGSAPPAPGRRRRPC